ncbi:MAG TPA: hypothetical protein ENI95_00670 [Chloroflexi bacterium]|nr:hypothetical protein [Chloroflexota bacterium]
MPFEVTPVDANIVRCKHTGPITAEDSRKLVKFLRDLRGKMLLVDLSGTTSDECARKLHELRPIMPKTAIFGAELPPGVLAAPESYYTHEVRWFRTEREALAWLRGEPSATG